MSTGSSGTTGVTAGFSEQERLAMEERAAEQPAYARKGKVVCFFRSGDVDKERYSTFGFTSEAGLDAEGGLWATSFAVTELSETAEVEITALVQRATT